jgi:hypothetical protein
MKHVTVTFSQSLPFTILRSICFLCPIERGFVHFKATGHTWKLLASFNQLASMFHFRRPRNRPLPPFGRAVFPAFGEADRPPDCPALM